MSTVNAAVRLRTMILGIRPSLVHASGVSPGVPVDNLSEPGIEAWRNGLTLLGHDLDGSGAAGPRDRWIQKWIELELDRDHSRWSDASSMLGVFMVALGFTNGAAPAGRAFWAQWQRNLSHLADLVDFGAASFSADTAILARHCLGLAEAAGAPSSVVELFDEFAARTEVVTRIEVFGSLASEVERIYLAEIAAASFASVDPCRAVLERFYNPSASESRRVCTAGHRERSLQTAGRLFRDAG